MTTGTKIALGIAIAAAIAIGGYYGFINRNNNTTNDPEETLPITQESTDKKMAFEEFAKQGGTYKCTVQQTVNDTTVAGTVYMDKGLIRGEYGATYGGQSMTVTFILRDGMTYVWNSMMPTMGFKMRNDTAVQMQDQGAAASGSITASLQQIGSYDCAEWTADPSRFVIPTDVTFQSMN